MPFDERELLVFEQFVGAWLQVMFDESRLKFEQVLLGRSSRHMQIDTRVALGAK